MDTVQACILNVHSEQYLFLTRNKQEKRNEKFYAVGITEIDCGIRKKVAPSCEEIVR